MPWPARRWVAIFFEKQAYGGIKSGKRLQAFLLCNVNGSFWCALLLRCRPNGGERFTQHGRNRIWTPLWLWKAGPTDRHPPPSCSLHKSADYDDDHWSVRSGPKTPRNSPCNGKANPPPLGPQRNSHGSHDDSPAFWWRPVLGFRSEYGGRITSLGWTRLRRFEIGDRPASKESES